MTIRYDRMASLIGISLWLAMGSSMANPTGGVVVGGNATITTPSAGVLEVNQGTTRAAIDWRTFSISTGETVNFLQPSKSSSTLNRVLDAQASVIDGALNANGQVLILNSSGVLFGKNANVNVNGLIATTSGLATSDFMAGGLNFIGSAQPGAAVENQGKITVSEDGLAALVAPTVRNSGVISARLGSIALAAGDTFTVDLYGDHLINFALPTATAPTRSVTQNGSLIADSGRVLLTTDAAAGIVHGVVNMSGTIQANAAAQLSSGSIVLSGANTDIMVTGTLAANGGTPGSIAGSIDLLGSSVELGSAARVDASGTAGGGTVRVGGGFQSEASTRAASSVSAAPGATIDVSATESGNAGKVSIWGKHSVDMAGTILATGGVTGGNGGYIEVSGGNAVSLPGNIVAGATKGHGGTLLLDPSSITIQPIGGSDLAGTTIAGNAVNTLLRQGVAIALVATDSITIDDLIDSRPVMGQTAKGPSGAFSLQAGTILVLQPIISNNGAVTMTSTSGNITFQANSYVVVADTTSAQGIGDAGVTLAAAGNITANQIISLGRISVTATGNVQLLQALNGLQNGTGVTGIGDLNVSAAGSVSLAGADSNGNVSIAGANGISISAPVTASGALSFAATSAASAITLAATSTANTAGASAGGDITITSPGAVTLNSGLLSRGGSIAIGSPTQAVGAVTLVGGTALQAVDSASAANQTGGISIYTTADLSAQDLIAGSAGAVTLQSQGAITLNKGIFGLAGAANTPDGIGALTVTANGNITTAGATVSGFLSLTSTGGTLTNAGATLASGGTANLSGASINLGAITSPAGATVAALSAHGDTTLAATAGDIAVGSSLVSLTALSANATGNIASHGAEAGENLTFKSGGALTNSTASLISTSGAISLTGNSVNIAALPNGAGGLPIAALDASGNVAVSSVGATTLAGSTLSQAGNITVTAGGDIATAGAQASGTINLTSNAGTISNSSAPLNAGGNISLSTPGAVALGTTLVSHGGNISIGSAAQPVSSATFTGNLQSVDSLTAAQTGGITIYSTADLTIPDLIAGSRGAVVVSSGGSIALTSGLFGLDNGTTTGAGIGALTLNAGSNVATNGALVNGPIVINATGSLQNSTATLDSMGSITLSAASISLNALAPAANGNGLPQESLKAAGDIVLATNGAVEIDSEIQSTAGNIQIGSAAKPVTSIATTLPITVTSTGDSSGVLLRADTGSINATAVNSISTTSLVAGTSSVVALNAKDVTVSGAINDAGGIIGVGEVAITGTNSITVHDINVSGNAQDTSGVAPLNGNSVILATTATGGSVAILGPINSGGSVFIGQTGPYVADADPHTTTPSNAQINLSNNISTNGNAVVMNGDVTLFAGITRWDIECAITGVCYTEFNHPVDSRLFSAGNANGFIVNVLDNYNYGSQNNLYKTSNIANACNPTSACTVGYKIQDVNTGNLTTITCSPTCGIASATGQIPCNPSACIETVTNGNTTISTMTFTTAQSVVGYDAAVAFNAQSAALAKLTAYAIDATGTHLAKYNTSSGGSISDGATGSGSSPNCDGDFVCGIHQADFSGDDAALLGSASLLAANRLTNMDSLFGSLTASIDTTGSKNGTTAALFPAGANVTIAGSVSRFRGPQITLPTPPASEPAGVLSVPTTDTFGTPALGYITPTFVSDALSVHAGNANISTGLIGDDLAKEGTPLASVLLANTLSAAGVSAVGISVGASQLGSFFVSLSAGTVELANAPQPYVFVQNGNPPNTGYHLTGLSVNATTCTITGAGPCGAISFPDMGFAFDYAETTPAAGSLTGPITTAPPSNGLTSSATTASGSMVQTTTVSNGSTSVSVSGAAGAGALNVASAGAGLSLGGLPTASETAPETTTVLAGTQTGDQNNNQYEKPVDYDSAKTSIEDSCPRGEAQSADLGLRPGYGVAPNVFIRCRKELVLP